MSNPTKLHDYLTQLNPTLHLIEGGSMKNTSHPDYPFLGKLCSWKDFELETIRTLFDPPLSEYLNESHDDLPDPPQLEATELEIRKEKCLKPVLEKFHQKIVTEALGRTTTRLLGMNVVMVLGRDGKLPYKKRFKPDLAGRSDLEDEYNVLPGDAKLSRKFGSSFLSLIPEDEEVKDDQTAQNLWPIRQLLCYAVSSGIRYGYIFTDEELIVLRIGTYEEKIPDAPFGDLLGAVEDSSRVEWCAIPWENSGNKLTINLALWALHILAANNGVLNWEYEKLESEKVLDDSTRQRLLPNEPEPDLPADGLLAEALSTTREARIKRRSTGARPIKTRSTSVHNSFSQRWIDSQENTQPDEIVGSFAKPEDSFRSTGSRASRTSGKRKMAEQDETSASLESRKKLRAR